MKNKQYQLVEHRKKQILLAAKRIFAQNGFRKTTVDQIAESLNVGKGTLYRYFKNKKSLFLAVFERGITQLHQIIKTNVESVTNPQHQVAAAVKTYFEFFDNDRELIEIMMQVRSEFKDDYKHLYVEAYRDYIVKIQNNLRNGVKMGIFREMDVEKTAEAISATLQGILQGLYLRTLDSENAQKELLADRTQAVSALLLDGLLKPQQK